jgi:hypothetical protein
MATVHMDTLLLDTAVVWASKNKPFVFDKELLSTVCRSIAVATDSDYGRAGSAGNLTNRCRLFIGALVKAMFEKYPVAEVNLKEVVNAVAGPKTKLGGGGSKPTIDVFEALKELQFQEVVQHASNVFLSSYADIMYPIYFVLPVKNPSGSVIKDLVDKRIQSIVSYRRQNEIIQAHGEAGMEHEHLRRRPFILNTLFLTLYVLCCSSRNDAYRCDSTSTSRVCRAGMS